MVAEILIVDDDEPLQRVLTHRLESDGYEVTVCADGKEAVETLESGLEPDLVVLDVMMPRLDGKRLLRMIRNDGLPVSPSLPVIMLTSKSREEDILEAFESGADDFITKPFSIPELTVRVEQELDGSGPDR